ncbi:hypothetical protein [Luteolibacter marinus]|uniref:hypothetical protein n=1 Tax=Luteolibacter marinus TaxID=2776705 RepID=UPI0018668FB0|nr:hypothetical protein [Luteolibacter marinus]
MIRSFNRKQRMLAVWNVGTGLIAYGLAWCFFFFVTGQAIRMLPPGQPPWLSWAVPATALVIVTASGWRRFQTGKVEADLSDAVMWKAEVESAGAFVAQYRVNQVSSLAWSLSQLFLAGPLRLLEAVRRWRSCLPEGTDLELRMTGLLRELKSRNQWVDVATFRDHWEAMAALIRTGQVEFSSIKGRVRASS